MFALEGCADPGQAMFSCMFIADRRQHWLAPTLFLPPSPSPSQHIRRRCYFLSVNGKSGAVPLP